MNRLTLTISKLTDFVPNSLYGSTKRESVSKYEDRKTDRYRDRQRDRDRNREKKQTNKKQTIKTVKKKIYSVCFDFFRNSVERQKNESHR